MSENTTIAEVEALTENYFKQREVVASLKTQLEDAHSKQTELERMLITLLQNLDKEEYLAKAGRVSISKRMSWRIPKGLEEKEAFMKFLSDRGVFDSMITVNSKTLQSFCNSEFEAAKERGEALTFKIPGIDDPIEYPVLNFRKGK